MSRSAKQLTGLFQDIYQSRNVLVTGHTGFKGSWLSLWLSRLGAQVTGLALPPSTEPSHWDLLQLDMQTTHGDIRDLAIVEAVLEAAQPEIVFHLAAQPLVRPSYANPLETWSTNVMGTANVLDACRRAPSVRAVVAVTTDKCYRNQEQLWGYRESDPLGGHDPYSASKAGSEMVVESYRKSFFSTEASALLASARAGNVIGGGDWSIDRLIPDAARAVFTNTALEIRSPLATRPWQHVLDCLAGYLQLGQRLLQGESSFANAWNFGPGPEGNCCVESVLTKMQQHWMDLQWCQTDVTQPHEATLLQLDCTRANQLLEWKPVWDLNESIAQTAQWYRAYLESRHVDSLNQLNEFIEYARTLNRSWTGKDSPETLENASPTP